MTRETQAKVRTYEATLDTSEMPSAVRDMTGVREDTHKVRVQGRDEVEAMLKAIRIGYPVLGLAEVTEEEITPLVYFTDYVA